MGDKPSKSHSEDEIFPPHLARTDFHFTGTERISFSDASSFSDGDNRFHSRPVTESFTDVHDDDSVNPVNGASTSGSVQSSTVDMSGDASSSSVDSKKLVSPKRQVNSKPTSPDHSVISHDTSQSIESLSSSLLASTDGPSISDMALHCTSDDVSVSSLEPPSPSTSSTKTVISVINVQDPAGSQSGLLGRGQCAGAVKPSLPADGAKSKLTLGDILQEIENRSKSLLLQLKQYQRLPAGAVVDLQFLAQQSRYGTDANVKRRILTKLVECGLADILAAVFRLPNLDDCFRSTAVELVSKPGNNGAVRKDKIEISGVVDDDESDASVSDSMRTLKSAVTLLWNTSDKLATFCEQCVRAGIVPLVLDLLQDRRFAATELHERNRFFVVRGCIGAMANFVRMCDDDVTRETCRSAGAVRVLQQYLRCTLVGIRTKALVVLSYVANESENDLIHATDKNLAFAVKMLLSAIECDNHYSSKYGYWAVEIMAGVNRLACYESNKERLHAAGLLSLCVRLMDASCSDDEILVATQTFWILSFNASVRAAIRGQSQYMSGCRTRVTNHLRWLSKRLLGYWRCDHQLRAVVAAIGLWLETKLTDKDGPHVLLVSHHTSRQAVLKVRNRLRGLGYHVHIDPDLRGAGMESAIDNVNRAAVVLVFMSNRLKNSPACRTELEYAASLKKPLVLVRLHRTFVADGWLTTALGELPVTDLVDDENFETMIASLVRQMLSVAGLKSSDSISSGSSDRVQSTGVVSRSDALKLASNASLSSVPGTESVASWASDDVEKWLRCNNLDFAAVRLRGLTGDLLLEMKRMQQTAPESFYSTLRTELQLDFISVLRLSRALGAL